MKRREGDLVPRLRHAIIAAAADAAPPEFASALADAVLTAIVLRANSGEEHQMIAAVLKGIRAGVTEAIERKPELLAEQKRKRK